VVRARAIPGSLHFPAILYFLWWLNPESSSRLFLELNPRLREWRRQPSLSKSLGNTAVIPNNSLRTT
jgi:hypothetical protein